MPKNVYRIGSLAGLLKREPNTIHKWEAFGVIAESEYRDGNITSHRVYTKAEMMLIYKAMKAWYKEHYTVRKGVCKPQLFRFGQIYWDMRKYLEIHPMDPGEWALHVPPDYEPPEKLDFVPAKTHYDVDAGDYQRTYMEVIYEVNCSIRDSETLIRNMQRRDVRCEFLKRVYQSKTLEDMRQTIQDYEEIVKNAEANSR